MNLSKPLKNILEDITNKHELDEGKKARIEYDLYKTEIDRKRNTYQFWITIFLATITIVNLVISVISLYLKILWHEK